MQHRVRRNLSKFSGGDRNGMTQTPQKKIPKKKLKTPRTHQQYARQGTNRKKAPYLPLLATTMEP